MARPIYEIAKDIRKDWKKMNPHAVPYFRAMESLDTIEDRFMFDSADMIVRYFLSNATTWRGEKAREIKAELNAMLK